MSSAKECFFSKDAGELRFIILRRKRERSLKVQNTTRHPTHTHQETKKTHTHPLNPRCNLKQNVAL
jgi:hypothetical protein